MRKTVVMLASMTLAVLLACGAALAVPMSVVHCSDCLGDTDGWCMGAEEDDTIYGTNRKDLIDGQGGDDTILGYDRGDVIVDKEGRNQADGGRGDDFIGGRGKASGGPGGDTIRLISWGVARGGTGDDNIRVHNERRNTVFCGTGHDRVYFDRELDTLQPGCERRIPHAVPIG